MRVMLVGAGARSERAVREFSEAGDHEPTFRGGVGAAWCACRIELPHLLLVDREQTGAEGLRLCRQVRSLPDGANCMLVVLEPGASREAISAAFEAGADDVASSDELETRLRFIERQARWRASNAQTNRSVRTSEERYRLAFDASTDAIWDWDLETDTIHFSAGWRTLLECDEGEIGDRPEDWFRRVHREDLSRLRAEIAAHLEANTSVLRSEHRIRHDDGDYRWVLCRGRATRDESAQPMRLTGSLIDITAQKELERQLLREIEQDRLTRLPNRSSFIDSLENRIRRDRRHGAVSALLLIDLDRFKTVNDSLGHSLGDRFLIGIARRLRLCLRRRDLLARLGGDEFAILLNPVTGSEEAMRIADRIRRLLAAPVKLAGNELCTTASIGVALAGGAERHPEDLLRDADMAMVRAKVEGKDRCRLFDDGMHVRAVELLRLETDLRRAVDRRDFQVRYQPIVALDSGRIVGFEALVRWRHPERGLLKPIEFLPIAEEMGLMVPIGEWVLCEACRQLADWHRQFPSEQPLTISVNLSSRQLSAALVDAVQRILEETGLQPGSLRFEITESNMMSDAQASVDLLHRLKDLDIQLHIDDFGTGYSSLSSIHSFPIDTLKIDRSFVGRLGQDEEADQIVRTITTLAENLGMDVIAEGIETDLQLDRLRNLHCSKGQGFLFAEPLDSGSVQDLMCARPRW